MADQEQSRTTGAADRKPRRTCEGVVLSGKRDKTIKVQVEELRQHPRYNKYLRRRTVMHVHDENNEAKPGDRVEIMETRPISKTKTWRLLRIVRRSESVTTAVEPMADVVLTPSAEPTPPVGATGTVEPKVETQA